LKHTIAHQFYQTGLDSSEWMRLAASILAHHSNAASIVTAPHSVKLRYKHLQLISTTGRQVLMVLVSISGKVSQQMLVLSEPVTQEKLSATAEMLNKLFFGREADEISAVPADLDALGSDMKKLVLDEMRNAGEIISGEVYQDGWTNVLGEPEFSDAEAARRALRILEERPLLEDLLSQTVMNTEIGGVQVLIGGEGTWQELSDCSLVLARYGVPELASGILGVLGPIRMPYRQTISTVNYMAGLMSNLISESMSDSPDSSDQQHSD
jgi:heat-inducible transcriptional repressor